MTIWREFFQDENGVGSSSRLNMLIGVTVGSITVLWLTFKEKIGGEIFGVYMACTGGVYAWGKTRESMERVQKTKSDSPYHEPPAPNVPNTVIQVGGQPEVKDVAIEAKGTVNVNKRPKSRNR